MTPCFIHANLSLVRYRSKSSFIALVWFGDRSLWFTLFYCKVMSSHELGSCVEGHHKSTYHSMNLRWHNATSGPSCNQSCMPNQACHLHIYLIDSRCSGANWPNLSCQDIPLILQQSITYPSLDLHHLLTGLQRQMYPCVRNLSIGLGDQILMWTGNIPVCGHDRLWHLVSLRYIKNGPQQDSIISILAPAWCLLPSQWPLLQRLFC